MSQPYPMLVYPVSVLGSPDIAPGTLCGTDEVGRPYEVLDVGPPVDGKVEVYLQYATQESINRQIPKLHSMITGGTLATGIQA
jgi:hypothetical protein